MRGCVTGFRGLRFEMAGKSRWDTRGAMDRLDLLPVELRFPRSCTVHRAASVGLAGSGRPVSLELECAWPWRVDG